MFFFDNFIITHRTLYAISGFMILFIGTILNFALAGLFKKNSQRFSNAITTLTLGISSLCFLPFIFGFLNPNSLKSIYFFNKNIAFGGLEILLCFVSQIMVLIVFLILKKYLAKLRFKQYYFNSLFLCSVLALNALIITKGFIPFILSLETISICAIFIMLGFKNRTIFFQAYKYLLFSFCATVIMILCYALSFGFETNSGVLQVVSKILFTVALLLKGGFSLAFAWGKEQNEVQNYPYFVFANTVIFFTYAVALHKMVHDIFETGSFAQIFFTLFFIITALLAAFKITRANNFKNFTYGLNTFNFCILGFLFFIQNVQIHACAILLLFNILIVNFGLLSSGIILNINKNTNLDFDNFKGICYSNPLYCKLLSVIVFISASILPSGIFICRFYTNTTLAQTGLWSSIVMFIFAITYTLVISSAINFVITFYKKPANISDLKAFKKRTNLNYSILFLSIVISLVLFIFSGHCASLIINFL